MLEHDLSSQLREALASCYPDRERAKLMAFDAGLDLAQLDLSGAPVIFWQRILDEAERRGRVNGLLDLAIVQAPARTDLVALKDEYRALSRAADQPPSQPALLTIESPVRLELVRVPAGEFLMGSDPLVDPAAAPHEQPQHSVELRGFYIGKYPVTNRQYAEFLKRNRSQPEPPRAGWSVRQPPQDKLDHPVVSVGWQDAVAFCAWLSRETRRSFRLPSEAEWEKAARGTGGERFPWGDEWVDSRCNVGTADTTPVSAHPAGASLYGCHDMLGNVEEWSNTQWGSDLQQSDYPYPYRADDGREDAATGPRAYRIHRGGSYASQPGEVRCAARDATLEAKSESRRRGFRVVMS